jgi:hypothetical protein
MKIYALPEELEDSVPSIVNTDWKEYNQLVDEHQQQTALWLKENGFNGTYSGEVVKFPFADGYAQYMLADGTPGSGNRSFLLHLPYGDGWNYPHVEHIPKKEIVDMVKLERKRRENPIFGST